jgi:hypothetical protein
MSRLTRTHFRHEPHDKQKWLDAADACGLSLSEFIRAALDHVSGRGEKPMPRPTPAFARMDPVALRLLRGACNNLNQIVHAGHVVNAFDVSRIVETAEIITALVREDLDKASTESGVSAD